MSKFLKKIFYCKPGYVIQNFCVSLAKSVDWIFPYLAHPYFLETLIKGWRRSEWKKIKNSAKNVAIVNYVKKANRI